MKSNLYEIIAWLMTNGKFYEYNDDGYSFKCRICGAGAYQGNILIHKDNILIHKDNCELKEIQDGLVEALK
jgi:hypothetical protein